jgi:hypothetical protein
MKKISAHFMVCIFCIGGAISPDSKLFAGNDNFPYGARGSGMGNACVTIPGLWSVFYNQANLVNLKYTSAGIHHEMNFGISQLSTSAIAFAKPLGNGTLAICSAFFGYRGFRESKTGVSYSLHLFRGISAGVQLEYLGMNAADNSARYYALSFELGILASLSKELELGVHVFNPANIHYYGRNGEPIPPAATIGLGYKPVEFLVLTFETEEKLGSAPLCRAGIEFGLGKQLFIRTGISTIPWENSFGAGVKLKSFTIDLSVRRNPVLGYSPACSIGYEF